MDEKRPQVYYLDCGVSRVYINYRDNEAQCLGNSTVMPLSRLEDFIATAKALGIKAGRV